MSNKYKSDKERVQFIEDNIFTVSKGDIAEFYYVPLQGHLGFVLSMVSIKHLILVVRSKEDPNKFMSMGFYPTDGNILGALLSPKNGYLWSPDPHYIPTASGFEPAYLFGTEKPIVYTLQTQQAQLLNTILFDTNSKLKDGELSRGKVKRDRLECPIEQYMYCPMPGRKNTKNCVTWLYHVFHTLSTDLGGTFEQVLYDIHVY